MRKICRAALTVLVLAFAGPASAHHVSTGTVSADAIVIPSLSHGQMAVIAENRSAILALAAQQFPTDETFRRLLNFANIQRMLCLWGLMPGSVHDEASPFNECSHAYLAAAKALLLHMEGMAGQAAAASALAQKIDIEMLRSGAALVLCRYSGEPFNTAELIYPRLGGIIFHPPSLAAFGSVALLVAVSLWLLRRRSRRSSALPGSGTT